MSFKKHINNHVDKINKLADDIDAHSIKPLRDFPERVWPEYTKKLKGILSKADTKHLHILKHYNMGLSGISDHPAIKHIDTELKKRGSSPSQKQVEDWDEKYYTGHC